MPLHHQFIGSGNGNSLSSVPGGERPFFGVTPVILCTGRDVIRLVDLVKGTVFLKR